jgi:hypothetical protein
MIKPQKITRNALFNSRVEYGPKLPVFSQQEVKDEIMLFSCDTKTARDLGGPITQAFLNALHEDGVLTKDCIFDTRVHMLMPGWYPAIPGWHHDDVPRDTPNGQPNYTSPAYHAQHAMALVGADVAPTNFALGTFLLTHWKDIPEHKNIYEVWDKELNEILSEPEDRTPAVMNQIIKFDAHTFHEGVAATGNGWRWFGRVSWDTHRKPVNEIRRQVQVYLEYPKKGW